MSALTEAGRQTDRQTDRQREAGRQTDRQAGRQAGRQVDTSLHHAVPLTAAKVLVTGRQFLIGNPHDQP